MLLSRIKEFIDSKGISISAFEKSIGAANASFAKPLKVGGNIGSDKLENILRIYAELNPVWLMTGKGDMLISSNSGDKNAYPNAYQDAYLSFKSGEKSVNLSPKARDERENKAPKISARVRKEQLQLPELLQQKTRTSVPFYNLPVSAGSLGILDSDDFNDHQPDGYIDLNVFDGCEALFPVIGVSMEPLISGGDWIGIKKIDNLSRSWDFLQTGVIYLIITNEDRMIKFVEKATDEDFIICNSPNYSPFKVYKGDIRKLYRVKACAKKL